MLSCSDTMRKGLNFNFGARVSYPEAIYRLPKVASSRLLTGPVMSSLSRAPAHIQRALQ